MSIYRFILKAIIAQKRGGKFADNEFNDSYAKRISVYVRKGGKSSDSNIVSITGNSSTAGTATVDFELLDEGMASITASYGSGVTPVSANIVVERTTGQVSSVTGVNIKVYLKDEPASGGPTIPIWLTTGINTTKTVNIGDIDYTNLADVLKMDPSAMTTIGTLEVNSLISTYTLDDEGGYLYDINGFESYYDMSTYIYYGWQYRVRDALGNIVPESITDGASIVPLYNNYTVEWFWGSF